MRRLTAAELYLMNRKIRDYAYMENGRITIGGKNLKPTTAADLGGFVEFNERQDMTQQQQEIVRENIGANSVAISVADETLTIAIS